jgi:uncharacterized protein YgbK (DUF1537 family)
MSVRFGAIADDVTGGVELAALMTAAGVACDFVTDPALVRDGPEAAVVIALKTRTAPVAAARAAFADGVRALQAVGARQIFFKYCATFDSTPAGNIGPCADVLMDATTPPLMLFSPSFPEAARTVYQGHLFVGDRLVSESPKKDDPLTPMTDPDLCRVLAPQTGRHVGLLPLQDVQAGVDALRQASDALACNGVDYAIVDAVSDDDLRVVAELTVGWPAMSGNSSVAGFYPDLWRGRGEIEANGRAAGSTGIDGPAVVLAGSCAERTLEQLVHFARHRPVLAIDLLKAMDADPVPAAVEWAAAHMAAGPIAIATSAAPAAVTQARERLGRAGAAALAEDILGRLAAALRDRGARRFLVAGGETSGAVLSHLDIRRLAVGPYQRAGVAGAVSTGSTPIALCLKSGKLGPPDMFLGTLEEMRMGSPRDRS